MTGVKWWQWVIAFIWPPAIHVMLRPQGKFPPIAVTPGEPILIPDAWLTWEGKERGEPMPPIIWYGEAAK